jgi:HAD superfamily hydrolase (TIGR01490 family)
MKLAVFDIDGVLYNGHSMFDIIKLQEEKKFIPQGTWHKIEVLLSQYKSGEINYTNAANAMLDVFAQAIKGKTRTQVKQIIHEFIVANPNHFYTYFREVIPSIQKTHDVYLITANLRETAETITEEFHLSGYLATELEVKNGKFSGKVLSTLAGNKHKIAELLSKYGKNGSLAVGDSVNDIPMLELVDHAICINPDEKLAKIAKERNWIITTPDQATEEIRNIL